MLHFKVINHQLCVGQIEILGVSSASMMQVGDTDIVSLYAMFDTPPESVVVGPIAPFPLPGNAAGTEGE
ncbi:spore gernimation protein GerPD [Paenibacillus paridis]|jgi:spore germination protein PD|uniref:spore gernimation protein GerPD n=1 Tax=Paenibacillus paridis TaxID=2583376 RepID=UPI001124152A|nr:spore gernimation protein GerPD [Paenibacillus paridis]